MILSTVDVDQWTNHRSVVKREAEQLRKGHVSTLKQSPALRLDQLGEHPAHGNT